MVSVLADALVEKKVASHDQYGTHMEDESTQAWHRGGSAEPIFKCPHAACSKTLSNEQASGDGCPHCKGRLNSNTTMPILAGHLWPGAKFTGGQAAKSFDESLDVLKAFDARDARPKGRSSDAAVKAQAHYGGMLPQAHYGAMLAKLGDHHSTLATAHADLARSLGHTQADWSKVSGKDTRRMKTEPDEADVGKFNEGAGIGAGLWGGVKLAGMARDLKELKEQAAVRDKPRGFTSNVPCPGCGHVTTITGDDPGRAQHYKCKGCKANLVTAGLAPPPFHPGPAPAPATFKGFATVLDILKDVGADETATQGAGAMKMVKHRQGCPKSGGGPCGGETGGKCQLCQADVRDHEVVGKTKEHA